MPFLDLRLQLNSPLFPYTTLFRSVSDSTRATKYAECRCCRMAASPLSARRSAAYSQIISSIPNRAFCSLPPQPSKKRGTERSEEHTSEPQSQPNLVSRLLLEKKIK